MSSSFYCDDCGSENFVDESEELAELVCEVCGSLLQMNSIAEKRPQELKQNDSFGSYVLKKRLGEGGAAEVFLAEHKTLKHLVAIKILFPHFVRNETVRTRFLDEGRIQAQLNHPNIVRVTDIIDTGKRCGIVMDWIDGDCLRAWISKPIPRSIDEIIRIFSRILSAVGYAHQHQIIHRDIKPENILLTKEKEPFLLDFGVAKIASKNITITGSQLGTPTYMAPEQLNASKFLDHRADIYTLGVLLFEMLTRRVPFESESIIGIMRAHEQAPIPDPILLRKDIPEPIRKAIFRALAKKPRDRFASCASLHSALEYKKLDQKLEIKKPSKKVISQKKIVLEQIKQNKLILFLEKTIFTKVRRASLVQIIIWLGIGSFSFSLLIFLFFLIQNSQQESVLETNETSEIKENITQDPVLESEENSFANNCRGLIADAKVVRYTDRQNIMDLLARFQQNLDPCSQIFLTIEDFSTFERLQSEITRQDLFYWSEMIQAYDSRSNGSSPCMHAQEAVTALETSLESVHNLLDRRHVSESEREEAQNMVPELQNRRANTILSFSSCTFL